MSSSELFGREEISIIQTRQLRKTIHYIYQRSPFYRDMLDRASINPSEIKTLDDLKHLPTTTAEDICREKDRFLCVRPEELADLVLIERETAPAFLYKLADADLARLAYHAQLSFLAAGLTEKDEVGLAVSLEWGTLTGMAAYLGLRRLGASVLRMGSVTAREGLRFLEQNRITALIASSEFLNELAKEVFDRGSKMALPAIAKVMVVGSAVRQKKFALNQTGSLIANTLKAKVISAYAHTETGTFLCECEAENGVHLHPELMHAEILDTAGQPLPEGQIGELCLTPFGVAAMPVLRYRTGVYTFLNSQTCACERQTVRLGPAFNEPAPSPSAAVC